MTDKTYAYVNIYIYTVCVKERGQEASKRRREGWDGETLDCHDAPSEVQAVEACAPQYYFSWSQNWGPKFGASSVCRKERGRVFVTNIGRICGAQKHACESDNFSARRRHSDMAKGW